MKHLIASFLLCFCVITQSAAANRYYNDSDWRSLPFVEMMVTMMKIMNNMMGIDNDNNSFPGLYSLPYSPGFMPGTFPGLNNGLGGFNNLPMSPGGMGNLPMNNLSNQLTDNFPTGKNANNNNTGNFWDPNSQGQTQAPVKTTSVNNHTINGIWQALSGDVIAIYNNNHFIWSDGNSKNIAGRLVIKGNMLYAYIPASKVTLEFQFYMEPGQFIVRDKTSRIYTFKRLH